MEMQVDWLATDNLRLSLAGGVLRYRAEGRLCHDCRPADVKAPAGTPLPITAEFKGNLIARYMFPLGGFDAHVQGSLAYEGSRASDLDIETPRLGEIPSSTFVDLAFGIENDKYAIELSCRTPRTRMRRSTSTPSAPRRVRRPSYGVSPRPRTFGIRFRQDF